MITRIEQRNLLPGVENHNNLSDESPLEPPTEDTDHNSGVMSESTSEIFTGYK
jgi:hypothetical protein